jgi:hypothetical protein
MDGLRVFRFLFLMLVGYECWNDIAGASKYGAGGFNVAQLAFLSPAFDYLGARLIALDVFVVCLRTLIAYGCFVLALFTMTPFKSGMLLCLVTAAYVTVYFSSQIDYYQHHYLVCLLLTIMCASVVVRGDTAQRSLQLLAYQVSWVYLWSGVAKLHGDFLLGTSLRMTAGGVMASHIVPWHAALLHVTTEQIYLFVAVVTVAAELFLCIALLSPRFWSLAAVVGIGLHLSLEFSGVCVCVCLR